MYCQKCGTHTDGKFCPNCGAPTQEEKVEATLNGNPVSDVPPEQPKKSKKKLPAWGKIGIVLLAFMLLVWAISENISDAVFATGLIGTTIYMISLIVLAIKKRSIKINLLCLIVSFALIIIGVAVPTDEFKKLDKYEWGSTAEDVLKEIGVKEIKDVYEDDKSSVVFPRITTEKTELSIFLSKDGDGKWGVVHIKDNKDRKKVYYDTLKHDNEGKLVEDIYSYETGEVIERADPKAKENQEKKNQEIESQQEKQSEDSKKTFKDNCKKIAYKELTRYPEKYNGQSVKFTGEVIQVMEGLWGGSHALRVNVTKGEYDIYTDTVYVEYVPDSEEDGRILEDDIITFYGTADGLETYESVVGQQISIPKVVATYIDIKS